MSCAETQPRSVFLDRQVIVVSLTLEVIKKQVCSIRWQLAVAVLAGNCQEIAVKGFPSLCNSRLMPFITSSR